jgi:hypothetical protein
LLLEETAIFIEVVFALAKEFVFDLHELFGHETFLIFSN